MDGEISNFVAVTGADEQVARHLLEMANGDLAQAVLLYYETDVAETVRRQTNASASASEATPAAAGTSAASASTPAQSSRPIGREDDQGVIHIDSDEDDMDDQDHDAAEDENFYQNIARTAQEAEDAAMAKRLQEEMYAETGTGAGAAAPDVRAPIARTTEVLVEPSYGGYGDYGGASSIYEQMRRRPGAGPPNPFNQVWDDDHIVETENGATISSRQARLADLFRPPYDLIERMSWDEARTAGKSEKRWILANLQDMSDFVCQALNRDIWKDNAVKELVRENFIFLQFNKEDPAAESYISYYMPGGQHENPDNYPHVAIIDPRTGEQVKVWSERPFPSASVFHSQLVEFLDRYSLDASKKNPVQKTKARQPVKDVGRMTEEEMLEMALRNSLAGANGEGSGVADGSGSGSGTVSRPSLQDPDELTMARDSDHDDKGKGREDTPMDDAGDVSATSSAFARIASDRPHEEPANGPATTRIQFRHPTGRVIRRFAVDDRVERIYEWLKAEPLEGKEGVEFELKVVPQGQDLIEHLHETVEEVGLKQATVMIEFLE